MSAARMMKIYLAGPMTGLPDFNRQAFLSAGEGLRALGHEVVDPVTEDVRAYGSWEEAIKRPWQEHLARDLALVPTCEGIALLPGWEDSKGANLELRIASTFKMPAYKVVMYATEAGYRYRMTLMDDADVNGTIRPGDAWAQPTLEATERSRVTTSASMVDPEGFGSPDAIHDARSSDVSVTFRVSPEFAASSRFKAAAGDIIAEAVADELESARKPDVSVGNAYDGDRFVPYAEDPARHVFGTGGIKDNRGKAPIDLVPSTAVLAAAEILAFGAEKYQPHNWRKGLPWPDTYSSLMRHLLAWNGGEDNDPETGKPHLWHAECQLMFLIDYGVTGVGRETDNRFRSVTE